MSNSNPTDRVESAQEASNNARDGKRSRPWDASPIPEGMSKGPEARDDRKTPPSVERLIAVRKLTEDLVEERIEPRDVLDDREMISVLLINATLEWVATGGGNLAGLIRRMELVRDNKELQKTGKDDCPCDGCKNRRKAGKSKAPDDDPLMDGVREAMSEALKKSGGNPRRVPTEDIPPEIREAILRSGASLDDAVVFAIDKGPSKTRGDRDKEDRG